MTMITERIKKMMTKKRTSVEMMKMVKVAKTKGSRITKIYLHLHVAIL
jgi:hypothetical protein